MISDRCSSAAEGDRATFTRASLRRVGDATRHTQPPLPYAIEVNDAYATSELFLCGRTNQRSSTAWNSTTATHDVALRDCSTSHGNSSTNTNTKPGLRQPYRPPQSPHCQTSARRPVVRPRAGASTCFSTLRTPACIGAQSGSKLPTLRRAAPLALTPARASGCCCKQPVPRARSRHGQHCRTRCSR